jgi:hypothetical protein
MENTLTLTTLTRPDSSDIDHSLDKIHKRRLYENTNVSDLKSYSTSGNPTYDSNKSNVQYITADSGTRYPDEPRVIVNNQNAYNTVLERDTDDHDNVFIKVGTGGTGAAYDETKPRVIVYENRREYSETMGDLTVLLIDTAVSVT